VDKRKAVDGGAIVRAVHEKMVMECRLVSLLENKNCMIIERVAWHQ
jgi:hypothetical protein